MSVKAIFLELIAKNDGNWTWYQLERGLNAKGIGGQVKTIDEIKALVQDGLIVEKHSDQFPNPLYSITDKGRLWLKSNS